MDRMRKLMGFSSSPLSPVSAASSQHSSSSSASSSATPGSAAHQSNRFGYHAKNSVLTSSRYSHNRQQPSGDPSTNNTAASLPYYSEDHEQNNHLAGVNLGSGKMTVSKSGRWKKKERRRLSLWDEESATSSAADGPASLPSHPAPGSPQAAGASHPRIVFQELGKHKRTRAPAPPAAQSSYAMASGTSNAPKSEPWMSPYNHGTYSRSSSISHHSSKQQQPAAVSPPPVAAPRAASTAYSGQPPSPHRRSIIPLAKPEDDSMMDDATIAELIEDFETTIGMHDVDDEYDVQDDLNEAKAAAAAVAGKDSLNKKGSYGRISSSGAKSVSIISQSSSASSGAPKPHVIPRQAYQQQQPARRF